VSKVSSFERIVVFQPRSAWVVDLGPGNALFPRFNVGEGYFDTAAGTRRPVSRTRELVIPVFDSSKIEFLQRMHREGCEVRAILISKGAHVMWGWDSAINLVPFGGAVGTVSGANLVMNTDVFWCPIYQNTDLLAGIPWECEDATSIGGTFYFPGPTGWKGPRYTAATGMAVDENGALTGTGTPQLEMIFPMQGMQCTLGGTFTGSIKTLDHTGNTITTTNKNTASTDENFTVDTETWKIQVDVTNADTRPTITVRAAGSLNADRSGDCIDCSDPDAEASSAPSWSS